MTVLFTSPITTTSLTDGTFTPSATEGSITVVDKGLGNYALQSTLPAGATYQARATASRTIPKIFVATTPDIYVSAKVRFTKPLVASATAQHRLALLSISGVAGLRLVTQGGVVKWGMMTRALHADGTYIMQGDESVLPMGSINPVDGAEHHLQLHINFTANGYAEAWIDGVLIGSVTGLNFATTGTTAAPDNRFPYSLSQGFIETFIVGLTSPDSLYGNPVVTTLIDDLTIADTYIPPPVIPKYTLIMQAPDIAGGSTVPAAGTYSYDANSSAQITATPATGYTFTHWIIDGVTGSAVSSIPLLMDSDATVKPVFTAVAQTINITLAPTANGDYLMGLIPNGSTSYTGSGPHSIPVGTTIYFGVAPKTGYIFTKLVLSLYRVSDGSLFSSADYSFTINSAGSGLGQFSATTINYTYVITPVLTPIIIPNYTVSYNSSQTPTPATIDGESVPSGGYSKPIQSGRTIIVSVSAEVEA